jgi:hypothetical protein
MKCTRRAQISSCTLSNGNSCLPSEGARLFPQDQPQPVRLQTEDSSYATLVDPPDLLRLGSATAALRAGSVKKRPLGTTTAWV